LTNDEYKKFKDLCTPERHTEFKHKTLIKQRQRKIFEIVEETVRAHPSIYGKRTQDELLQLCYDYAKMKGFASEKLRLLSTCISNILDILSK
jgi:hypothetical protein